MIASLVSGAHAHKRHGNEHASGLFITVFAVARAIGLTGYSHSPPQPRASLLPGDEHMIQPVALFGTLQFKCQGFKSQLQLRDRRPLQTNVRADNCPFFKGQALQAISHVSKCHGSRINFCLVPAQKQHRAKAPFRCVAVTRPKLCPVSSLLQHGQSHTVALSHCITAEATPLTPHRGLGEAWQEPRPCGPRRQSQSHAPVPESRHVGMACGGQASLSLQ